MGAKIRGSVRVLWSFSFGRLAQLVQSVWFTPRRSGVRIPYRPHKAVCFGQRAFFDFRLQAARRKPLSVKTKTAGDRFEGCDWLTMHLVSSDPK
jgi:hypothetical protein